MSLDSRPIRAQRVAIIGGGISGLAAAYLLSPHHAVTIFEAESRLGGHARTIMAGHRGDQPVDTGFIVFNYANYPHLARMLRDLDVPVAKSDMSFGASIDGGRIEYALRTLRSLRRRKGIFCGRDSFECCVISSTSTRDPKPLRATKPRRSES